MTIRNYISVDFIDASVPKVMQFGGSVVQPKAEVARQGWYAVVADSEGNEIALWESLSAWPVLASSAQWDWVGGRDWLGGCRRSHVRDKDLIFREG
jgi:hypothetical protein